MVAMLGQKKEDFSGVTTTYECKQNYKQISKQIKKSEQKWNQQ